MSDLHKRLFESGSIELISEFKRAVGFYEASAQYGDIGNDNRANEYYILAEETMENLKKEFSKSDENIVKIFR